MVPSGPMTCGRHRGLTNPVGAPSGIVRLPVAFNSRSTSRPPINDVDPAAASVRILGKGRKLRQCPLWPVTVTTLNTLIANRGPAEKVFLNRRRYPITRFGIYTMVRRYALTLRAAYPSIARKRLSPHTIRHYVARPTISAQKANASCFLGNWAVRGVGPQLITRHSFEASQVLQKGQQVITWAIAAWPTVTRSCLGESLFLHRECGVEVYLGSLDMLMTKPQCNGGPIDTFLEHINGHRVSQTVDGDAFLFERGTDAGRGAAVLVEQVLNAVNGEAAAAGIGNENMVLTPLRLTHPGVEHGASCLGERRTSLTSALADHSQMGASAKNQILVFKSGHLRKAKAGLYGRQHKRVIAAAGPGVPARCGEQRIDFWARKKVDQRAGEALARNGQDTLDLQGVLRRLKGHISKERMDRRQAQVTRAHADPVMFFQMVQKLRDQGRGDLLESKLRGPRVQVLLGELQQPTERIAIGGD